MAELIPTKKRKVATNYKLCVICQTSSPDKTTNNPILDSLGKIISYSADRSKYGEGQYCELVERLQGETATSLQEKEAFFHRSCYSSLVHSGKLAKSQVRYKRAVEQEDATAVISRKRGRPSSSERASTSTSEESVIGRKSGYASFEKGKCVFCQEEKSGHDLHEVRTYSMGQKIKTAIDDSTDDVLKVRIGSLLNDPGDAIAYDMKYHLTCWVSVQRRSEKAKESIVQESESSSGVEKIIADIELLNTVQYALNDSAGIVLNMNDVNTTYLNILQEHNVKTDPSDNYKRHLKSLITENIENAEFIKSVRRNEAERICSTRTKEVSVDIAVSKSSETTDIKTLLQASAILRNEISNCKKWTFAGSFEDYQVPQRLYSFMKWVIEGPRSKVETEQKRCSINRSASNLAQHVITAYKSDRQVRYTPDVSTGKFGSFRRRGETPLSLGTSLLIHQQTRKKSLIQAFTDIDIGESYTRTLRLENQLAHAVVSRMQATAGLYIPSFVVQGQSIFFAIDNIDFLEDTPTGKDTLHGTAIVMYQREQPNAECMAPPLKLDVHHKRASFKSAKVKLLPCSAPKPANLPQPNFAVQNSHDISKVYLLWDLAWIVGCTCCLGISSTHRDLYATSDSALSEDDNLLDDSSVLGVSDENNNTVLSNTIPTWAAYNSLVTRPRPKTNVAIVPPLLRTSPTSWPGLYTALMRAQHISVQVMGEQRSTVITLDLQLYEKAQKLMTREDMKGKFVLRIGELHTIFSSLKAVGRYVEGSGIDQLWVEAGMYSPTTVRQILEGKHLYRAMEAHMVTILVLYSIFFKTLLEEPSDDTREVSEAARELNQEFLKWKENVPRLPDAHLDMIAALERCDLLLKLDDFDHKSSGMARFLRNYMKQFECILRHVRASRQGIWSLHLAAEEELTKYFFAHDHLNYARLSPVYCAEMYRLERDDPDTWNSLASGDFCVNKTDIPFCSIGPDHGIEHENRSMKVLGGIIGITQNESALEKFFMIAPELSRLVTEFASLNGINLTSKRQYHHDLSGGIRSRVFENVDKMKEAILMRGHPFENNDEVANIMTKAVMPDSIKKNILERDSIGQKLLSTFVEERLVLEKKSVWSPMKKLSLKMFRQSSKVTRTKVGQKVIELREERALLARFVIISRSRPDIDLKDAIGQFEFSGIPRSLFQPDGTLVLAQDKANLLHSLEELPKHRSSGEEQNILESRPDIEALIDREVADISTKGVLRLETEENEQRKEAPPDNDDLETELPLSNVQVSSCKETPLQDLPPTIGEIHSEEGNSSTEEDLQERRSTDDEIVPELDPHNVLVIDGMALVNTISKADDMKTCQDFAAVFIRKLHMMSSLYSEIRLLFDKYIEGSLKEKMREKRTGGNAIRYHVDDKTDISNVPLKQFLSHIGTKAELTAYLAKKSLKFFKDKKMTLIVAWDTVAESNREGLLTDLDSHSHEEADTLIALHCLDVSKDAHKSTTLDVFSPDTDVFLLLLYWYPSLCENTFFMTGKGQTKRSISVRDTLNTYIRTYIRMHSSLGDRKAKALLGFHSFTGADTTGKFSGRTKATCFKAFMASDTEIIEAFISLGSSDNPPSCSTCSALERFVCQLYTRKGSEFSKVSDLRWFLFSQKRAEGERLPPTFSTLMPHILRAHFVARIWKTSDDPRPVLPLITDFGWQEENGVFVPVKCLDRPAPESVLLLVKCSCTKDCSSSRCSCVNAKVPCTEFCGCGDECQNSSDNIEISALVDLDEPLDYDSDDEEYCA